MKSFRTPVRLTALALGIVAASVAGSACASGFQIRENSVKNLGRGNAGTAVAKDDASVVSNNPAAMVNLDKVTVRLDASAIDLDAQFRGDAHITGRPNLPVGGGNGGDPGDTEVVPALAVVVPLSGAFENLTLGASITAPFGLKTEYDRGWVGRFDSVKSEVKTADLTLSAALKLTDRFSVGAGLIYERADVTLANTLDVSSIYCGINLSVCRTLPPPPEVSARTADALVKVEGDDTGIGWTLGFQWRPTDRLSIGYSHRSEIDHDLGGDISFAWATRATDLSAYFPNGAVRADLTTPSVDTLSVQYDFSDRFRMMADVQRTDWHSLKNVIIRYESDGRVAGQETFGWEDSTSYALGAEYDLNDAFVVRAGVAKDESPVGDATRSTRLPDNDRMLYSVGATWRANEHLSFDAAYMRVDIDGARIDRQTLTSTLRGTYTGHADVFGLSAQYAF